MRKILKRSFFELKTTVVARGLLGKYLVRKYRNKETAFMITEVEVYDGFNDSASHASRGKTERNKIMFGGAGYFYVYLTYGMHYMLNIVTGEKDYPSAVLIRTAGEYNGPGKLTYAFKIDKKLNNKIADKKTGLWIEDRGVIIPKKEIGSHARVGVNSAGPYWSKKKLRFMLK